MPRYSPSEYNAAGDILRDSTKGDHDRSGAMDIIGNLRAAHAYPMEQAFFILGQFAKRCDDSSITAQRLKRVESIELKLAHQPKMRLTQMQDIGGCRVIVKDPYALKKLSDMVLYFGLADAVDTFQVRLRNDYIAKPKDDGYRSIHMVANYVEPKTEYKGLKVEIQLRTQYQHVWATTVEICQFFKQQRFKTQQKTADKKWLRYFALASGIFVALEGGAPVSGIPFTIQEIQNEMLEIDKECEITTALTIWSSVAVPLPFHNDPFAAHHFYVLDLRAKERTLESAGYPKEMLEAAEQRYIQLEKEADGDLSRQVVLVSADSLQLLRSAYPNYFVDASRFVSLMSNPKTLVLPPNAGLSTGD